MPRVGIRGWVRYRGETAAGGPDGFAEISWLLPTAMKVAVNMPVIVLLPDRNAAGRGCGLRNPAVRAARRVERPGRKGGGSQPGAGPRLHPGRVFRRSTDVWPSRRRLEFAGGRDQATPGVAQGAQPSRTGVRVQGETPVAHEVPRLARPAYCQATTHRSGSPPRCHTPAANRPSAAWPGRGAGTCRTAPVDPGELRFGRLEVTPARRHPGSSHPLTEVSHHRRVSPMCSVVVSDQ